ncbi:MAG TPA: flagellar biosynthesis protein FlhF, partial [Treponemataceae bacterium]|nr:flagellar biosynthesis protein FlhF [Treponemataceae bacterium]
MDILSEQAATYEDCIAKIRQKYGPNIQILRQKKIRMGGFMGFWERDGIELYFMLSRDPARFVPKPQEFDEERKKILRQAVSSSPELAAKMGPSIAAMESRAQGGQNAPVAPMSQSDKDRMEAILRAVKNLEAKIDRPSGRENDSASEHETLAKLESLLELNDFSASYTRNMISRAKAEFSLEDLDDYDAVQETVLRWIGESIPVSPNSGTARPRVIVLVGPTGVGKTTTVAKLAAAYSLAATKGSRPLNVRVITIDNYRIGAKQQIEIYGNIMNIPVSCAETPQDLEKLMALYQDVDIVLIDTIGKSPKDYSRIAEMRHFLDSAGPISDIHLAMSATTKASDMREIMQQYETFGYGSVIITKFDETTRVGNIISTMGEKKKPIAYITTGQRVPQDFEQASVVR